MFSIFPVRLWLWSLNNKTESRGVAPLMPTHSKQISIPPKGKTRRKWTIRRTRQRTNLTIVGISQGNDVKY